MLSADCRLPFARYSVHGTRYYNVPMRRLLAIATFALLLSALPACAQRMSGGSGHGFRSSAFAGSPTRAGFARGGVLFPGSFGFSGNRFGFNAFFAGSPARAVF